MAKDRLDVITEELSKLKKELEKCSGEIKGKIDDLLVEIATISGQRNNPTRK